MIKLADTLAPMADFPAVEAKDVAFSDNKTLQEKYDNGELGGGGTGTAGKSAYEIAVDNGFVGNETEWLESLKGSDGDKGDNGTTPHIDETTKNWFIGDTDTGILAQGTNGKDGKSISTITKDDDNNIIVTFTDGSKQNIGKLSVDIQGDFLTSDGFGNLRYYNGHFQYYDTETTTWIDTSCTQDNIVVMNLTPQTMKMFNAVYDIANKNVKLYWKEPLDTIIDGQALCIVEGVKIVRKINSEPENENDGDVIIDIKRKDFNRHGDIPFIDLEDFSVNQEIFYKAFPYSTSNIIGYSSANCVNVQIVKNELYSFSFDTSESEPNSIIKYINETENYMSAYMNYDTKIFNYGSWENAFFIRNTKIFAYDHDNNSFIELNKNNYSMTSSGNVIDITSSKYSVLSAIPTVWIKIEQDTSNRNIYNFYISASKLDDGYHAYAHTDVNGNIMPYTYIGVYHSSYYNGKLRSVSGGTPYSYKTISNDITYSKANGDGWNIGVLCDRMLIGILLLLMGKNTDTQAVFGNGNADGSSARAIALGIGNDKGLFYGENSNTGCVKVFGIENWWGNYWNRTAGMVTNSSNLCIKLTEGAYDGSTESGYNLDGSGYIQIGKISGSNNGYCSDFYINQYGIFMKEISGSASTYIPDMNAYGENGYLLAGGGYTDMNSSLGAFCLSMLNDYSIDWSTFAPRLSYKPPITT